MIDFNTFNPQYSGMASSALEEAVSLLDAHTDRTIYAKYRVDVAVEVKENAIHLRPVRLPLPELHHCCKGRDKTREIAVKIGGNAESYQVFIDGFSFVLYYRPK